MRLFFDTASLTVSRSSEDSSPKTIRPLQSTIRIPSFVCVASFSCIKTLLCDGPNHIPVETPLPHLTHQPIACAAFLASCIRMTPAAQARSRPITYNRVFLHELHRSRAQIPSAEILRGDRTGARHPHLAECSRTR